MHGRPEPENSPLHDGGAGLKRRRLDEGLSLTVVQAMRLTDGSHLRWRGLRPRERNRLNHGPVQPRREHVGALDGGPLCGDGHAVGEGLDLDRVADGIARVSPRLHQEVVLPELELAG